MRLLEHHRRMDERTHMGEREYVNCRNGMTAVSCIRAWDAHREREREREQEHGNVKDSHCIEPDAMTIPRTHTPHISCCDFKHYLLDFE